MKKGFTLIELLAVIIIIGVVMAISIPSVIKVIDNRKRDSLFVAAKNLVRNVEYDEEDNTDFIYGSLRDLNVQGISSDDYDLDNSYIYVENDIFKINLVGKGDFRGLYACGVSKNSLVQNVISEQTCEEPVYASFDNQKGVNKPKLAPGMTAVKWNGTSWDTIANPDTDTSWYDYPNKMWANAMTEDGSMWVWIPRYIYKISSGWHTATAGTINIQFSIGTDDTRGGTVILDTGTTANASNNKWTNHPAFTFGTTELTGFWMAKFEPSVSDQTDLCYTSPSAANCNKTTLVPKIIPNAMSWKYIQMSNSFTVSRNMETNTVYGWGTSGNGIDTHLIKNIEWGAVSYLSKSIYGQNTDDIWANLSYDFITGCAGDSGSGSGLNGCLRSYETTNGQKSSTTGTIYGVYDMSGNSWEQISAYVDNGNASLNTDGSSVINADLKYKDVYEVGAPDGYTNNYDLTINKKGDAVYETSASTDDWAAWFSDNAYMPNNNGPWFLRSGDCDQPAAYQGTFLFIDHDGRANFLDTFRPVLLVGAGL